MKNKNFFLLFIILLFLFFYFLKDAIQSNKILFGSDTISISYPFKVFAKEMLFKYHIFPVWMPYLFFGIPLIDSTNLIFFYPTDFIFYFLPVSIEKTYLIDFFIHLILAFWGTYLFLRILELKQESAILGGVFYMFSGVIVSFAYVGHFGNIKAASLIPFIFYFFKKGINTEKLFYFLTAAIFFALQILAIGMQVMAYTYLAFIFYFIYELVFNIKDNKKIIKLTIFLFVSTVAMVFFSALQFFQSSGYTAYSWRANFKYENFVSWSFHPFETITFFLPHFFGLKDATYWGDYGFNQTTYYLGIIPFLLILFGFNVKKYKNYSFFFSFLGLLFLFLSFGGYSIFYKIFYYVPVFNNFRNPSRFLYIFNFSIVILSAIGFNNILLYTENKNNENFEKRKILIYIMAICGLILFFLFLTSINNTWLTNLLIAINNIIKKHTIEDKMSFLLPFIKQDILVFILNSIAFILLVFLIFKKKIKNVFIILVLFLLLHCYDNFRINKKFIYFADLNQFTSSSQFFEKFFRDDNSIFRIANFSNIWYPPNMNILSKIESISGYHGLAPDKYYKLLENQVFNNVVVNNLFNIKYYIVNYDIEIPYFIKLYDDSRLKIYKNQAAKERFIFYDKIKKFNNENEILEYLKQMDKETDEVFVIDNIKIDNDEIKNQYSINILKYLPHKIELEINTVKKGLLFISNMFYPEWKAKVNGFKTKIYRANFAGMGILLEKGLNKVELYYDLKKIIFSLLLTIFALLIYIIIFLKKI